MSSRLAAMLRWRQVWAVVSSILVIGLSLWAGTSTLPLTPTTGEASTQHFASAVPLDAWLGRTSLLFTFEDDLHPRQCGTAFVDSSSSVELSLYRSAQCKAELKTATASTLHPAAPRLLWSLIPESDRRDIGKEMVDLGRQMLGPFVDIINSPYFVTHYRAEATATLLSVLRTTWSSPAVQSALAEVLASMDAAHTERLVNRLWPIAVEKAKAGLWDGLSGFGEKLFGSKKDAVQRSMTGRFLQDMVEDPRTHLILFEELLEISADPGVLAFANVFAAEALVALMSDPQLPLLLNRIATDPYILAHHRETRPDFDFLTQDLPRRILRYRHPRDHNPLAAYLVRSILRADGTFVVFMMTEEQTEKLAAQGLGPGIPLTAAHP